MPVPLVLLPALLCDQRLYAPLVAGLAGERPVVVADLSTADDIGLLARQVLDRAPPAFALLGLSMGGYVAFEILRRAPERVSHLALCCTRAEPDTEAIAAQRQALVARARDEGIARIARELAAGWIAPTARERDRLIELVVAMAEGTGVDGFARQQTAIRGRPDSRPGLAAITCPTLVVAGREDPLTPPTALEAIAAAVPNADLAILGGCGHLASLERPRTMLDLVRGWLGRA